MLKANPKIVRKAGRKSFHFNKESAENLAFVVENAPEMSISEIVREGVRRVKVSVEKKLNGKTTQTN